MGSNWSSLERESSPDPWWPTREPQPSHGNHDAGEEVAPEQRGSETRGKVREDEIEAFKQELARKRALRHEALATLQNEMRDLRRTVEEERTLRIKAEDERDQLKNGVECWKKSTVVEEEIKVEVNRTIQAEKKVLEEANSQVEELKAKLEEEREEKKKLLEQIEQLETVNEEKSGLERQIQALKDVSQIGKEMLKIRELQVKELKKKLVELNMATVMSPPEDLRIEYEKQIENIRKLRTLYEERAAATLVEHQRALEREEAKITVLEIKLSDLQKETEEIREVKNNLEGKIETLEKTIQRREVELETTKDDLISSTVQNKSLNSQMTLINNLFSQMLVSPKVDLDRLIRLLKDNHGLISDLTMHGDSNEVAALLVDLAEQVEKEEKLKEKDENGEVNEQSEDKSLDKSDVVDSNVEKEISNNLSKVWRVMIELLSHHQNPTHTELAGGADSCYKCVQTPSGPRSVISVSQTFLTLKDLILEKNHLVKEVGRLKTLNNHLEHRLGSQEKRLSVVTTELRKTWGVVNKLKAQHKQLHTHEKILRYELQQKRCMLTELKQELEYCKDKWEKARQKNSETEEDWKKLRKEFAARKTRTESNSAESGYEEDDSAQSPPSEPITESDLFKKPSEAEVEVVEDDIEHSDGNSFDTVIDLLDITYLENQPDNSNEPSFLLVDVESEEAGMSPNILPLTSSDFTEGLDQIESEDLASVLDIQYQNQLLGADYNLSLPSSSASSPVPTENDDFASSEMEISEEDSFSHDSNAGAILTQPEILTERSVPEDTLLFGSNSSQNISKFLDGLFTDNSDSQGGVSENKKLSLLVPSSSQMTSTSESATPLVENDGSLNNTNNDSATPLVDSSSFEFPNFNTQVNETETKQTSSNNFESGQNSQELTLKAREDRLKRLEQNCRSIVSKVTSTSFRNEIISSNHDKLHFLKEPTTESSKTIPNVVQTRNVETNGSFQQQVSQESGPSTRNETSENCESQNDQACSSAKVVETVPSCSRSQGRTPEQILEARAARLKRLEEQCKSLFSKMSATSTRSDLISNKLDALHESYGTPELTTNSPTSKVFPPCEILPSSDEIRDLDTACGFSSTSSPKSGKKFRDSELALESKELLNKCSLPGPSMEPISINSTNYGTSRTPEQILEARAERLKRLEEQCKSLVSTMTATSLRSEIIANKLDELHSCYGSSEDASDNDEQPAAVSEETKTTTPVSSPRHARRIARLMGKDEQNQSTSDLEPINTPERTEITSEDASNEHTLLTESAPSSKEVSKRTPEEILKARDERLKRMEEQCKSLFSKMSATSERSNVISSKLEDLHEQYGQTSSQINQPSTSSEETPQTSSLSDTKISRVNNETEKLERPVDENNVPSSEDLKETNCSANELRKNKEDNR